MEHRPATLHVFNPWHDEALASGSPFYCPTRTARRWADRMGRLPLVWAPAGDAVMLADGTIVDARREPVGLDRIGRVAPWGWDALLCRKLRASGLGHGLLPGAGTLAGIRALSHRRTAARLLESLTQEDPLYIGRVHEARSMAEIDRLLGEWGTLVLKAPWSGSGRGVWRLEAGAPETFRRRAERVIRLQGSLMAEPLYDRRQDFGMEFEARADGSVAYAGLSLFDSTAGGEYTASLLLPEDELRQRVGGVSPERLGALARSLETRLGRLLAGRYTGPLGVDMMTVMTPGGPALHPAVEINLRLTMGHVALRFLACHPETAGRRLSPEEMLNYAGFTGT